jgi:hypothetical protein
MQKRLRGGAMNARAHVCVIARAMSLFGTERGFIF